MALRHGSTQPQRNPRRCDRGRSFHPDYIDADGTNWDGFGSASDDLIQAVTGALLDPDPATAVVSAIASFAAASTAPPDAYGTASLERNGQLVESHALPKVDNDYRPFWPGVEWRGVPLDDRLELDLDLTDSDDVFDDPIGHVVVSTPDLLAAAATDGVYAAQTADQGSRDILFVEIEVIPEQP